MFRQKFTGCVLILLLASLTVSTAEQVDSSKCLSFDGIDDVVNAGKCETINGVQFFTVEMWVRIDTFSAWRTFFCKFDNLGNRIQFQQYKDAGKIAVCVNNKADIKKDGNQAYFFTPDAEVTIGDWFHLAMVFDGTLEENERVKLYINGMSRSLQKDESAKGKVPSNFPVTKAPLLLGAETPEGAYGYKGLMDEVRIWTVARSSKEIRDNMERSLEGNEKGLQVYYPMTASPENPLLLSDMSQNNNHGKIVNSSVETALIDREVSVPTEAATDPVFKQTSHDELSIQWKRGSGSANAVFITSSETSAPVPQNSITYNADMKFGKGSRIGTSEWYCIYNGYDAEARVSGLSGSTEYRLAVVDYNGTPGKEKYKSDSSIAIQCIVTKECPVQEVKKKEQVITFSAPAEAVVNATPVALEASSSSGLPITFTSSDTSVVNVENSAMIFKRAGSAQIIVSQPGDSIFAAASTVSQIITVKDAPQVPQQQQQPKPVSQFRNSLKNTKAILIAAGGFIVTGAIVGIIIANRGDNDGKGDGTGLNDDFPPSDPVMGKIRN